MDGFDDLLAPSRSILEENPFEDPFAKPRSSSPDPWSSFSQPSAFETSEPYKPPEDIYNSEPAYERSSTPIAASQPPHQEEEYQPASATGLEDPLNLGATAADADEDEFDHASSLRSPGFKESVPTEFSEITTIRPTEPEELEPSILAPAHHTHTSIEASTSSLQQSSSFSAEGPETASRSSTESPLASTSKWDREPTVISPLEHPKPTLNSSFANLALGGESMGGWQVEQSAWANEPTPAVPSTQASEDDSDDDKPIGQFAKRAERDTSTTLESESIVQPSRSANGIQPVFVISVEDPQKVGDPIRSFTMYTVHTRTTSPLFQKSSFSVLRRYSDFLWLYETLSVNCPGVVVPPVPEKSPFGRFDDQFVRQRRSALEKCINKISNHPVLGKDPDLKMFLESDSFALDIKHRKAEIAHERGGLMASIGQTIAGPRFHETDEWFDRQKIYLDSLESQLRGLVKAIDVVAKNRAEVAIATGEFAQTVADLSASDVGKQLSHSLASLAEVERKSQELQSIQSQQDVNTILSTADEYARLINSVRLAFSSRIRTYHSWQNADSEVRRVKVAHERNRSQGRVPAHSLNLIADAERKAIESKHEFEHVSKLIKTEMARFEQERVEDFKASLTAFLEGMISSQKELIGAWENYQHLLLKKVGGGGRPQGTAVPSP